VLKGDAINQISFNSQVQNGESIISQVSTAHFITKAFIYA
jgi:hypothetical protein